MKITTRGVLGAAFILLMCALCVRLGFWQLDRLKQRKARNAAIERAMALPPLTLDSARARAVQAHPAAYVSRRVRVTGTYDPAGEVVLRGRSSPDGNPGVHLVTPMAVPGVDGAVLVNRGWVPSADAVTVDPRPFAEPGERTVEGIFQEIPTHTRGAGQPATFIAGGVRITTYRRLDLDALRAREGRPVLPLYVQQLPRSRADSTRPPARIGPPPLDNGPHLSYAIQWFSFAVIGVVGLGILVFRNQRNGGA